MTDLFFFLISGHAIIPKYYYVPADFVEAEQSKNGSQKRFPSNSGRDGKIFLWGQALYNLAKLLGMLGRRACVFLCVEGEGVMHCSKNCKIPVLLINTVHS